MTHLAKKAVLHIFTTTEKSDEKSILCVVNAIVPPVPQWLPWSEVDISWTWADHPPIVQKPGWLTLVVDGQVEGFRLTKVLMDGGSSINILYAGTFVRMKIPKKRLQSTKTTFHGIVPSVVGCPRQYPQSKILWLFEKGGGDVRW
jgi:hypothetical protein